MKTGLLLVLAVVLGCNYYGPENPPPDPSPNPTYTITRVDAADPGGLAVATCPAGTIAISGGGDCVACAGSDPSAYLFGNGFSGASGTPNSWVTGCYPGCAHAEAMCMRSSNANTLRQGLEPDDEETLAMYRAMLDAKRAVGR